MLTEVEKFKQHVTELAKDGGRIVHISVDPNNPPKDLESTCAELNRMLEAPSLPDPDVLGKYSPL